MGAGTGTLGVDIDQLRSTGNDVMRAGDAVEAAGRTRVLIGTGAWGHGPAASAGVRFADRFEYLVRTLGEGVAGAGYEMRASAAAYDEMELAAVANADSFDWTTS